MSKGHKSRGPWDVQTLLKKMAPPHLLAEWEARAEAWYTACFRTPGGGPKEPLDDHPEYKWVSYRPDLQAWLRPQMEAGRIVARGSPDDPNAKPVTIAPAVWKYAVIDNWADSNVRSLVGKRIVYFYCTFTVRARATNHEQADCKAWLVAEMLASPDVRPKPKAKYLEDAQKRWPGISERYFNFAWAGACDETKSKWRDGGAPKKGSREPHRKPPRKNPRTQ